MDSGETVNDAAIENPGLLRRWAAWLRGNAHRQVRGRLRARLPDGTIGWCALGGLEEADPEGVPTLFCRAMERRFLRHVVALNERLSFGEIAEWLTLLADGALSPEEALRLSRPEHLAGPRARSSAVPCLPAAGPPSARPRA